VVTGMGRGSLTASIDEVPGRTGADIGANVSAPASMSTEKGGGRPNQGDMPFIRFPLPPGVN
jgi:hypothetical protein